MINSFKRAAVATVAIVSFASAHAESLPGAIDSFTLGTEIRQLLSFVTLEALGTATFSPASATVTLPATSTSTSSANGSDLITFTQGAGLKITSGLNVISLADLSFNNSTKSIDAIISLNGAVTFSGTALTSTEDSTLNAPFLTAGARGSLTSGAMHLTGNASTALANALGFGFLAPALPGYNFGKFNVTAPVPEPSSYALVAAGLGMVGLQLARKRKAV